jgi:hypothetical protein
VEDAIETAWIILGVCVLAGIAAYVLISGEFRFRGGQTIRRADEPLKYWLYSIPLVGALTWLCTLGILRIAHIWVN